LLAQLTRLEINDEKILTLVSREEVEEDERERTTKETNERLRGRAHG
jgi:hypothetical protein